MKNIFLHILILTTITLQSAQVPEALPLRPAYLSAIDENAETILQCPICYDESTNHAFWGQTRCRHIFHIDCINAWTSTHNTCPSCRSLIIANEEDLRQACIAGNIDYVRAAIDLRVNLNFRDERNTTPLIHACAHGHEAIVRLLLHARVNINLASTPGYTALRIACEEDNTAIANILLENGASVLPLDTTNTSMLMVACNNNNLEIVNLLLNSNDTNINEQENEEFRLTALHYACQANYIDLIEPLLNHGADMYIETTDGISAYEMAELLDDHAILNIFNDHIAALEEQEVPEESSSDEDNSSENDVKRTRLA